MSALTHAVWGALCLASAGVAIGHTDESKEPALSYQVYIGEKSVTVTEGQSKSLDGNFKNPSVRIEAAKHREFPYMGVRFSYPRAFVFEADLADSTSKSWTLTGNDLNIMLFQIGAEISTLDFANTMIGQFGAENAKVGKEHIKGKFGNLEIPGSQLDIKLGPSRLQMDIMKLPSEAGVTKLLVFQDNIDEQGRHSSEGIATMKMVKRTFSFQNK